VEAVDAVLEATPTTPTPMIAVIENKIVRKPLIEAVELTQAVAKAFAAKDFNRAMGLRDAEFCSYYDAYKITTDIENPERKLPEDKVGFVPVNFFCRMLTFLSECESQLFMSELQPEA
jgi:6-phosphofructokinase 1